MVLYMLFRNFPTINCSGPRLRCVWWTYVTLAVKPSWGRPPLITSSSTCGSPRRREDAWKRRREGRKREKSKRDSWPLTSQVRDVESCVLCIPVTFVVSTDEGSLCISSWWIITDDLLWCWPVNRFHYSKATNDSFVWILVTLVLFVWRHCICRPSFCVFVQWVSLIILFRNRFYHGLFQFQPNTENNFLSIFKSFHWILVNFVIVFDG